MKSILSFLQKPYVLSNIGGAIALLMIVGLLGFAYLYVR